MGNAPSSQSDSKSGGGADETSASAASGENNESTGSKLSSPTKPNFRGTFNPNISIQTLGSGGPGEDAGVYYNLENPTSNVGLGAALVGGGANNNINLSGSGDVILSSLPKDLSPTNLGGQIVAIQRLLPGSGRMMRSYRMRVRVAAANPSANTTASDNNNRSNGVSTVELACKSFIVRSEKGEAPLRMALIEGDAELKRLRTLLSDPSKHPHILSYSRWLIGPSSSSNSQPASNFPVARPIYLIRQHAHASLSDRLFSRPFLTMIEKNWITFQLLRALQSLHDAGVCHGHLTTENILLTSWNWVLISDVGCQHFKPVALPDDDPGLWIHWFEGRGDEQVKRESWVGHHRGGDKKCCLAPERFYTPGCDEGEIPTELTPANDIFSLGCVLIELFLGGERALDLGDLMEYRRQGKDSTTLPQTLKQKLDKIESSKMRAACKNMMSLDPSARLTPIEYLERLSPSSKTNSKNETKTEKSNSSNAPMPTCFQAAIYPFMLRLRTEILSPDARISLVACHYGSILKAAVGVEDDWGDAYFARVLGPTLRRIESASPSKDDLPKSAGPTSKSKGQSTSDDDHAISSFSLDKLLMETDSLLRQLDSGMDSINYNGKHLQTSSAKVLKLVDDFTQCIRQPPAHHSSIIVLLQVVFSAVRHVQRTSSKFVALKLMHRIALFSSDDIRLQRIVPFVTSLLQDSEPIVRASSISVLASVLATVTSFPPSDAQIFPKYVFKKVAHLITDASLIVRVAFAKNIAILAETALRFLDLGHSVSLYEAVAGRQSLDSSGTKEGKTRTKSAIFSEEAASLLNKQKNTFETSASTDQRDATTVTIRNTYDSDLAALHEVVFRWVIHITTDTSDHSSQSKQALLSDLPRLCNFFRAEYSFQLLPIILAFLNDRKDWQLRAALCRHLPSVCVSVGRAATEQFVIPCIETALNDEVEKVIIEALNCLSTLISLSLLTRVTLLGNELAGHSPQRNESPRRSRRKKQGVVKKCASLLVNSSPIVRKYAAALVITSWNILDETDAEVFLNMLLRPYLRYKPMSFDSISHLFACLKPPHPKKNITTDALTAQSNIDLEIEISAKLASILSVPNQQSVELVSACAPKFYEAMMRASLENQALSASFLSLGFVALRQGKFSVIESVRAPDIICTPG
jgi:phosphoinositide-3-kinase regulatory subunit 4